MQKAISNNISNTPGTRVGPGFRDQTLVIKSRINTRGLQKNYPSKKKKIAHQTKTTCRLRVDQKRKVSVNNGLLCLQSPPWVAYANNLDQKRERILQGLGLSKRLRMNASHKKKKKGQLCFRPPPRVVHTSRLDQKICFLLVHPLV